MEDITPSRMRGKRHAAPDALVVPQYVSQHTAPIVLGFPSGRQFIRWAKAEGLPIHRIGHSLLVPLADCVAAISRHVETDQVPANDDATTSLDDVRAALGVAVK